MLLIFTFIADIVYTTPSSYSFMLYAGKYTVHLYGGQGGHSYDGGNLAKFGGKGAHVKGIMKITGTGTRFYSYVGGQGKWLSSQGPNSGGYNGGGSGGADVGSGDGNQDAPGGGGGATDLRIFSTDFNNRIMVAAGGSGAARTCSGCPGGGINGYRATGNDNFEHSPNVNQVSGNSNGVGQSGDNSGWTPGSGGGGGWRGGPKGGTAELYWDSFRAVAQSGSSYISGHSGCSVNSNMKFTDTAMYEGNHEGDGKLEIVFNYVCSSNCIDCTSATVCTKCQTNYIMYYNDTCKRTCPIGYVIVNSRCFMCSTGCYRCSTSTTHCEVCKKGYYYYNYYCYSECNMLNVKYQSLRKYFGNDDRDMTCKQCLDKNCLRCDSNYSICDLCPVKFQLINGTCIHDPTEVFTVSSSFSISNQFTSSSNFSYSQMFSKSNGFTESYGFSLSSEFSLTTAFTSSNLFSKTEIFSDSVNFTYSQMFSKSKGFSKSIAFSHSKEFSLSTVFTMSNEFSYSNSFSRSVDFTKSSYFSYSSEFSLSSNFTESNLFSHSSNFTDSESFSNSVGFSRSLFFTPSIQFSNSDVFTYTTSFTESNLFSCSVIFSSSSNFTLSLPFMPSNGFSYSIAFTSSNHFSFSNNFTYSNSFTLSDIFTMSSFFTERKRSGMSAKKKRAIIIGTTFAVLVIIAIATVALYVLFMKKKNVAIAEESCEYEHHETNSNLPSVSSNDRDLDFWL